MKQKREVRIDEVGAITNVMSLIKEYPALRKEYKVFFRGKSFDFESFRNYSSDEDASNIDWVASARYDKLLVKQYREEEKDTVLLLIDVSDNMVLGRSKLLKCERAAEIALSLAYLILSTDNRVGFVLFDGGIRIFSPPMRGRRCFEYLSAALKDPNNYQGGSDVQQACEFVLSLPRYTAGSAIIISDFSNINEGIKTFLSMISIKYETLAFVVKDVMDKQLSDISGQFIIEDTQNGDQLLVDPSLAKRDYETFMQKKAENIREVLRQSNIDFLEIMTDESFVETMVRFLKERIKKGGLKR